MKQPLSGNCAKCKVFRESLHRDHITPKWKGGLDDAENIQFICANCHQDKTNEESRTTEFKEMIKNKNLGQKRSQESIEKMKEAAKKRITPEYREKLSKALKGKKCSEEKKEKIREAKIKQGLEQRKNRPSHCIHGHEWNEKNTRLNKEGHRSCRACARVTDGLRRLNKSQS